MENNEPKQDPVWGQTDANNRNGRNGRSFATRAAQYPSAVWDSVQMRGNPYALDITTVASPSGTVFDSYDTQQHANSTVPSQIPPHIHSMRDPATASLKVPKIRETIRDKIWNMPPAIEPPFFLRRATYKARTPSPDTPSQNSTGFSTSTQTFGGVPVVDVLYPIRQPRGPRDSAKDIGFDWAEHARLNGRPNKSISQKDSIAVNSSSKARATPFSAFQSQGHGLPASGDQLKAAPTAWLPQSLATGPDPSVFGSFDRLHRLASETPPASILSERISAPIFQSNSPTQTQRPDHGLYVLHFQMSVPGDGSANGASFSQQDSRAAPRPYIPSTMVLQQLGLTTRDPARLAPNSSYQGDAFSKPYLDQVENLPDHENCSLWIKRIPDGTPHSAFFDNIHCGAVWSLHMNPSTVDHSTMGATLVFMKPESAAAVVKRFKTHGIQMGGNWLDVRYNKHGKREQSGNETRVLRIEGPPDMMTWGYWYQYFKVACVFQLDRYLYIPCHIFGRVRMEFRFSRVDGQSQSCRQKIERDPDMSLKGVLVWYGPDPCDQVFGHLNLL
ncbi:hypothetical protein BDZ45DRAFT_801928 [Acephala macrosclerotiorum]|nr:hypothetical protein BDZ45DRAFT_801928 [Acephala macrosclerotiorum]